MLLSGRLKLSAPEPPLHATSALALPVIDGLSAVPAGLVKTWNGVLRISTRPLLPPRTNCVFAIGALFWTITALKPPPAAFDGKSAIELKFPATFGLK